MSDVKPILRTQMPHVLRTEIILWSIDYYQVIIIMKWLIYKDEAIITFNSDEKKKHYDKVITISCTY